MIYGLLKGLVFGLAWIGAVEGWSWAMHRRRMRQWRKASAAANTATANHRQRVARSAPSYDIPPVALGDD